jgi:protein-tyrosine phosphatase
MFTMVRDRWQSVLDRVHAGIDRVTHRRSRARARTLLAHRERPRGILVVCTGNICRSPYAEAVLRSGLEHCGLAAIQVESAGFIGPDRPAEPRGLALAAARGVDLSSHRSRLVGPADASRFDFFLVMTRRHRDQLVGRLEVDPNRIALLGDFDTDGGPEREIADPFGLGSEVFEKSFDQIERAVEGLCDLLARNTA